MIDEQYVKDKYPVAKLMLELPGLGAHMLREDLAKKTEVEVALGLQMFCVGEFAGTIPGTSREIEVATWDACVATFREAAEKGDQLAIGILKAMGRKRFRSRSMNDAIDKYGWVVTGVPGVAMYTVGLVDKHDHPEFAVHGLHIEAADSVLRTAVQQVAHMGVKLDAPGTYGGIIRGYDARLIRVHPSNYVDWFAMAGEYHRGSFNMMQIVWPDAARRYPPDPLFKGKQLLMDSRQEGYQEAALDVQPSGCDCGMCGKEI